MKKNTISLLSLTIAALILATGCESSDDESAITWNNKTPSAEDSSGSTSASDQLDYGALQWSYGGVNGSGATHSGVNISGMKASGPANKDGRISWTYNTDLSNWGISFDDPSQALFCFFILEKDGVWRGGKLDWVSSSRTSRDLANIGGYHGWKVNANSPAQVAMVILHKDCSRRSNVITGTWSF